VLSFSGYPGRPGLLSPGARHARRALLILGCVCAGLLAEAEGASAAAPLGQITEFSAGFNAGSRPGSIAPGPDGNLWFTDAGSTAAIGRITPDGAITEFSAGLSAASTPAGIAPGPDGNVWFADSGNSAGIGRAIGRITPDGAITEFSAGLNPGSVPALIAPGPDGNLWFTDRGLTPAIGRITPDGAITEFSAGLRPESLPFGIAAGPDGNLWFTDPGNPTTATSRAIGRITTEGAISYSPATLPLDHFPAYIAAGPDGNMWFTDAASTAAIGRITPDGAITEFSAGLNENGNPGPAGIAPGADGNLWFTNTSIGSIGRITPDGVISLFSEDLSTRPGAGIAPGADGNLWFTEPSLPAIGRIGTEGASPNAAFTVTCNGLSCNFDGTGSTDPDGSIAFYLWDFGDGTSGAGATAQHTYATGGTYQVVLRVIDNAGAADTDSRSVEVIGLTALGYRVKGLQKVDLSWSGPAGASFDIYRDGATIATVQTSSYTDNLNQKGSGSYTYMVCEAGTSTCSNQAIVTFGRPAP
jgi:streptogramin lyase